MTDKKEGKTHSQGDGSISVTVGKTNLDDQISNIEDQLKKAQETLGQLQELKIKLEEDKKSKLEEAKKQQEILDATKVNEENAQLKSEIKSYQTEITSLKDVIASLKEDMVKTNEQLQQKVANSLKILEEADANFGKTTPINQSHKDIEDKPREHQVHIVRHSENEAEETPQGEEDQKTVANTVDTKTEEDKPEVKEDIKEPEAKAELTELVKTETKIANRETDSLSNDKIEPAKIGEGDKSTVEEAETISIEEELDEYRRIKEELSALESSDLPSVSDSTEPTAEVAAVKTTGTSEAKEAKAIEPPPTEPKETIDQTKTLDDRAAASSPDSKAGAVPIKVNVTQVKEDSQPNQTPDKEVKEALEPTVEEVYKAETAPEAATESKGEKKEGTKQESQHLEPVKEQKKKRFLFFGKKEKKESSAEPVKEEPKSEKVEDAKESTSEKKDKKKLVHLFGKKKDKEEQKHTTKADASGGMLMKTAILLLVLFLGGIIYQVKNADKTRQAYIDQVKGQVKGASSSTIVGEDGTTVNKNNSANKYQEAYADVPFANTNWVNFENPAFGIKMQYSNNSSYLYRPVDGNSIWFLRKNGYLIKIDKTSNSLPLDQYVASQKTDIEYSSQATTFKGFSAILLTQKEYLEIKGNIYYVQVGSDVYKIWYKTFNAGEDIDDSQRVTHMIDSIQFSQVAKKARK